MATLSSDHDDYRIGLNTPLQPTSDNTNWDPTASYAELLYQVLKNAPDKTMKLYDIYNWFQKNTNKAGKGCQNSIRYNLSMNAAFEMVEKRGTAKWRLTEEAVYKGVLATAKFRHSPTNKSKRYTPNRNPKRQASGAKGGRAHAARVKKNRLELLACSLPPHHTPDVNIGWSTTPEADALESLLPAYPHTDLGPNALLYTDQADPLGPSATFYQSSTLVHQWDWPGDAEIGFGACCQIR